MRHFPRRPAVQALLASIVFVPLGTLEWSLTALLFPLALMGLMLIQGSRNGAGAQFFGILVTPYLPFVLVLGAILWSQENITAALTLLGIIAAYVLARLLRAVISLPVALAGVAGASFVLGLQRQVVTSDFLSVGVLEKLLFPGAKNPTGWVLAFGLVAAFALVVHAANRGHHLKSAVVLFVALGVLLLLSDSVGSIVAGVIGVLAALTPVAVVSLWFTGNRKKRLQWALGVPLTGALAGAFIVLATNLRWLHFPAADLFDRDFSSVTGRTTIWKCYQQALSKQAEEPWEFTRACSGFAPAHLHSVFLEVHLLAGWVGVATLILGFGAALSFGFIQILSAPRTHASVAGTFGVGATTVGILVGLIESFFFYPLIFGILTLFLSTESLDRKPPWLRSIGGKLSGL